MTDERFLFVSHCLLLVTYFSICSNQELYFVACGRRLNNPFLQLKVQEMICFLIFSVFTGH